MPVDVDLGRDLVTIMTENNKDVPPFMFWEEQQKYLSSSKMVFDITLLSLDTA